MFIVIDGPDGSGKTTVAKDVVAALNVQGYPAIYTKEPTDSVLGRQIRKLLKEKTADPQQLFDLYVADRLIHIDYIVNCLNKSMVVVCDRYKYSTFCYQSTHGIDEKSMAKNNKLLSPDLTFILYSSPAILLNRIENRGNEKEIFENKEFLKTVVSKFLNLSSFFDEEFVYINTAEENNEVCSIIVEKITSLL